ncbi:MAG TPA: hypothetical protein VGN57_16145 [Pirellulaceae bacterium]|jgi:hypothetical protein|nr:hypothetical protein [Pirellulaceae bacterium]
MKRTKALFATTLAGAFAASLGCPPAEAPVDEPPVPRVSREPIEEALEITTEPREGEFDPAERGLDDPDADDLDGDLRGLDDDDEPQAPSNDPPAPDIDLPESLPAIDELPALNSQTTVDEATKLPFAQVGEAKVRDGVYVFRMNADGGGTREIMMTVETQTNGFLVRRGDQTRLRFVVDEQGVAFANEPGSAPIGGRGVASGDDWIRGAYRTQGEDGAAAAEGKFELRKLFDPKTPRAPTQP